MSLMLAVLLLISFICLVLGLAVLSKCCEGLYDFTITAFLLLSSALIILGWCCLSLSASWNKDEPLIIQIQELEEAQVCVYFNEFSNKINIINLNELWNRKIDSKYKVELTKYNSGWYYGIYWDGMYDLKLIENINKND